MSNFARLSAAIAAVLLSTTSCTDERTGSEDPKAQPAQNDLIPPTAMFCMPDDSPPRVRPVVDIVQDGRVFCGDKLWYDPADTPNDSRQMLALLLHLRSQPGVTLQRQDIGGRSLEVVDDPILIRADRNTEWHYLGKFMEQCSRPQAAFWRIEFAVCERGSQDTTGGAKVPAYLPKDTNQPVERLRVKIVCKQWGTEIPRAGAGEKGDTPAGRRPAIDLEGHEIHWAVGPRKVTTVVELREVVSRIMRDPERWVPDAKMGGRKPMPVVIEPGRGTTFGDVVQTLDVVTDAGANDSTFGGGMGARKRQVPR